MASEEPRFYTRQAEVSDLGYDGYWVQDRVQPRYLGIAFCENLIDADQIAQALNFVSRHLDLFKRDLGALGPEEATDGA